MVQELDKVAINLTDMKNLTTIKLKNNGVRLMSSEFLLSLVEKAGVGYYIMVNNKPEIVQKIENELIETVSGAVIPLSDVEEIKISSVFLDKIDPYLVNVIFKNNLYFNPSDSNADISQIPIFKDGYMSFQTSSESDKKYVHPYIEINGVKYKKFILDHNTTRVKFDTTNIEIGDIIIDKDPYTYYHVLDVNEVSDDKFTKTYITVLKVDGIDIDTHSKDLTPVIETINVDNLNIRSELWKTNTNINKSSIISKTNQVVFNPTDKLYEFLDTISKKFGTQIQIISDTTPEGMKWFAKIDNGTVLINMALKPADQSAENYILEKSLHEFAHLFLTVFRIQYPDQYVQMVKALPSSLNMGSFYTTTAANLDEFLVDVLMEMIKTDATNNPDSQEVLKIFNTALERIVNQKLPEFTPADWQASVFKLLKGIKIDTEQDMDLMSLREQAISDEFIDNVKLEC